MPQQDDAEEEIHGRQALVDLDVHVPDSDSFCTWRSWRDSWLGEISVLDSPMSEVPENLESAAAMNCRSSSGRSSAGHSVVSGCLLCARKICR